MIRARCHPALRGLVPPPVPAGQALPGWLRQMPSEVAAHSLGGQPVRTLKHCPPILDAFASGILIPLATDLQVANGQLSWDWQMPHLPDTLISRAPVGVHVPEQAQGAPFHVGSNTILKLMNFWTLQVPEGFSLLFTHPLNRTDLPFEVLSGVVDCDRFCDGYVHFPALWRDAGFQGTVPRGTPIAQVFAIPRAAQALELADMDEEAIARNRAVQQALGQERGHYRKVFRARSRGIDVTGAVE